MVAGEAAADGAWHADNVGPCLLGGITLIRSNAELDVMDVPIPERLWAAVAAVFASVPIKATPYVSRINPKGVHVLSES